MEKSSDRKCQFAMWLGKPAHLRHPETQVEFATLMGVAEETLTRWKKDPEVISITQNYRKLEAQLHLDEAVDNMTRRAIDGDDAETRSVLEWLGELDKTKRERPKPSGKIDVVFVTRTTPLQN